MQPDTPLTELLQHSRAGEGLAADPLLAEAYSELCSLARVHLATERNDHTLQPTALVHEAWLKIAGRVGRVSDRQHFFALASQAMRHVLTDHARGRNRQKRGGGNSRVKLDGALAASGGCGVDLVELEDLLSQLGRLNERHLRVVELRIFGGLTIAETAVQLGVSHTTIESDWFTARAWLRTRLANAI